MKNLLFGISLLIGASLFAQQDVSDNSGVFQFDSETINYGNIEQNVDGKRLFIFKNVGESAIIISKVKASCGCTVVTKPSKPILPGETAEIGVNYSTNRTGAFSKSITITSNASEQSKVLRIKGNVINNSKQEITSSN